MKMGLYTSKAQFEIRVDKFQHVEFNFDHRFFIWLIDKKSIFFSFDLVSLITRLSV